MKRKAYISLIVALLLIFTLFSGCSSQDTTTSTTGTTGNTSQGTSDQELGDVTIEGLIWAAEDIEGAELLYQDFMSKYPNITFNYSFMTMGSQQELTPRMAAGTFPNFVTMNGGAFASELCAAGWLADVSDTDAYNKMFDSLQKAFYDQPTGIAFGATCAQGVLVMWVNEDIFEASNAKVPTNYEEFIEACDKIKAAGYTPLIEGPTNDWYMSFVAGPVACDIQAKDPNAFDDIVNGEYDFGNSPAIINIYQQILDVFNAGYLQDGAMDTSYDAAVAAYCNGDSAMYMQGSWLASSCLSEELPFEPGVYLQPFNHEGDPQYVVTLPEDGYAVGAKATDEQIAASKLLLNFYLGDGFTYFQNRRGAIPSMSEDKYPTKVVLSDKLLDFIEVKNSVDSYFHAMNFFPSAVGAEAKGLVFEVMSGQQTPEGAAQTLDSLK